MQSFLLPLVAGLAAAACAEVSIATALDSSQYTADLEAEAEDRTFLASEWGALERNLERLERAAVTLALSPKSHGRATSARKGQATAALQLRKRGYKARGPRPEVSRSKEGSSKQEAEASKSPKATDKVSAAMSAALSALDPKVAGVVAKHVKPGAKLESADPAKLVASLGGEASPSASNAMALAPMLAMLKGLYEEGKSRIGELNKREIESKKRFAKKELAHKAELARIGRGLSRSNHTLSKEFKTNETREENRMFTYWQHCRQRQHKQFHNMLKIQHATMEREKTMIDMYEQTLAGKANKGKLKKQLGELGAEMPNVVLMERQRSVTDFCAEALSEVRAARAALRLEKRSQSEALASYGHSGGLNNRSAEIRVLHDAVKASQAEDDHVRPLSTSHRLPSLLQRRHRHLRTARQPVEDDGYDYGEESLRADDPADYSVHQFIVPKRAREADEYDGVNDDEETSEEEDKDNNEGPGDFGQDEPAENQY